jgi:uncharacterized radical SAM superfamily protein
MEIKMTEYGIKGYAWRISASSAQIEERPLSLTEGIKIACVSGHSPYNIFMFSIPLGGYTPNLGQLQEASSNKQHQGVRKFKVVPACREAERHTISLDIVTDTDKHRQVLKRNPICTITNWKRMRIKSNCILYTRNRPAKKLSIRRCRS